MRGNAVEIIDGQTFVLEDENKARFVIQLQFIEVPADKKFAAIAKDHLSKLILDKAVQFEFRFAQKGKNIGKVFAGRTDLSQQLLRDGAAWYLLPQSNLQDNNERLSYQRLETAAKDEKRGIWEHPNLKPSWEIKAEQQKNAEMKQTEERLERKRKERELANKKVTLWGADKTPPAESKTTSKKPTKAKKSSDN